MVGLLLPLPTIQALTEHQQSSPRGLSARCSRMWVLPPPACCAPPQVRRATWPTDYTSASRREPSCDRRPRQARRYAGLDEPPRMTGPARRPGEVSERAGAGRSRPRPAGPAAATRTTPPKSWPSSFWAMPVDQVPAEPAEAEQRTERRRRDDLHGRRADARRRSPAGRSGSRPGARIWRSRRPIPRAASTSSRSTPATPA